MTGTLPSTLASIVVGPVQFDQPLWLWLVPALWALTVLIGLRSLSGLGTVTRWLALIVRLIVILALAGALGEPHWRKESKDVAVTAIIDASDSIPQAVQKDVVRYFGEATRAEERRDDRFGTVTAAKDTFVQAMPSRLAKDVEEQHIGATDGTDLAAAVRLALAVAPKDAGNRLVIASDGNQTAGNILQAAETARALKIPIDVLPLRYKYEKEVLVDRLVAPATAREGETMNLRVVLQAVAPAGGRLTITLNGTPLDLDPDTTALGVHVDLKKGLNVLSVPVKAVTSGPQKFEAVFEPDSVNGQAVGDSLAQNNKAMSVTFVQGEGKVLVMVSKPEEAQYFLEAMNQANIRVDVRTPDNFPASLTELNAFDGVVMVDQSAYGYTQKQQEDLRQYIHDSGGGMVMVGGPDSFGAGGWIGSPVEDSLPVRLDPPQKRQMPRGALALVIHSVEAPDGVFLGKKVCEAAVNSLSRLDLVGIIEYGWNNGTDWTLPLQPVGDGTKVKRAIQNLVFGDMPDFTPSLQMAYDGLSKADAGQRHVIMISDGDPASPPTSLLDKFVEKKISISTVGVYPHSGGDTGRMQQISKYTGGRHYHINTAAGLAAIPQIFIKEAQTVRRSLIWEGPAFQPTVVAGAVDSLRGVGSSVPPITGYIVTAEREGLALVSMKGKEGDPILAQWQYGLGKVVAYTSDASSRWNAAWMGWPGYRAFWEQQVRWALRPAGSANVRVVTENRGDQTLVTVEALDSKGERLNFANFKGRLALPDGEGQDVDLRQVAPGRYQGVVRTDRPGSYVMGLRFAAPDENVKGGVMEGSVQAAITRPFADEYRTLEDNTSLLQQVAEMTGGKVLAGDPRTDNLWRREGVVMPVASRSIWLWVAIIGVGLFLMDVGVRRVRVDIPAIYRYFKRGLFGREAARAQELGSLRAAKEQARAKMTERSARLDTPGALAEAREAEKKAQATSKVKFEASAEQLRRADRPVALGGADAKPEAMKVRAAPTDAPKGPSAEEGMNRLMKAKQKAREGMEDKDDTKR